MDKLEYLKQCVINLKPLEDKKWYISTLGIPLPSKSSDTSKYDHLDLVCKEDGLYIVIVQEDVKTLEPLTGYTKGKPVFKIQELIEVDSSWLSSIEGKITTKLGNLLINAVSLHPIIGNKLKYINEPIPNASKLENILANLIKDDNDPNIKPTDISVKDYIDAIDRLMFFTKIANIITIATTEKTITIAPGTKQLRDKLLKENQDKLHNPVVVADIADKLNKFDKEYLADDPVAKHLFGKKGNTVRKKLFLMYGETNDFDASLSSKPITNVMSEGVDTKEENFPSYINDLRYASYSRGHSTQMAGYSYKILQRSLSGIEIVNEDCGTKEGLSRLIDEKNVNKLIGRSVQENNKWVSISNKEEAGKYLGKYVVMRSAMYCKSPGNTICYHCLGESYKDNKTAMTNLAASLSSEFMTLFLKRMHTSGFSLTDIKQKDLIT